MKKLLITAALVSAGFASCYKEKDPPDTVWLLTQHRWYMTDKLISAAPVYDTCILSEELVFNRDSTGYFFNPTPCDTNKPFDSSAFTWYLTTDKKNIIVKGLPQAKGSIVTMGLSGITETHLRIHWLQGGTHIAGFYAMTE